MKGAIEHGFALPLATLAVAFLSLGLVLSLPSSDELARELRHARARLTLERAAITAETRVAFLLLTEPAGLRGVHVGGVRLAGDGSLVSATEVAERQQEVVFDGRPYSFWLDSATEVIVRIQEKSGLINLTDSDDVVLANLLKICDESSQGAERLAADFTLVRGNQNRAGDQATKTSQLDLLSKWSVIVRGDRQRRINAAVSVLPFGTGIHLPTAPPPVLLALFGRNQLQTSHFIDQRNGSQGAANMAVTYNQNDYKVPTAIVTRQAMTGSVGLVVAINQRKLTIGSPLYFYQSDMRADSTNLDHSFYPRGQILHAGRPVQCYRLSEEVAQPLPSARHAVR